MSKYSIVFVAALVAIGLGLAGCHKSEPQEPSTRQTSPTQQIKQGAQQVGTGIAAAGKKVGRYGTDAAITTQVKAKLAANQGLSSFDIHVETNQGVVTLTGTVNMEAKRELAGRIAKDTKGVKSVVNDIVVTQTAGD